MSLFPGTERLPTQLRLLVERLGVAYVQAEGVMQLRAVAWELSAADAAVVVASLGGTITVTETETTMTDKDGQPLRWVSLPVHLIDGPRSYCVASLKHADGSGAFVRQRIPAPAS